VKILVLAFLVVGGSCGLLIPLLLYVLDLKAEGWTWQYVALFGSMCASTDAVAIVATMKTSARSSSVSQTLNPQICGFPPSITQCPFWACGQSHLSHASLCG
jgi:NhaP-type Na+/H+ or K+/H+ antiporter